MKFVKQDEKEWVKMNGYSKKILLDEKELKSRSLVQIVKFEANSENELHYHEQTSEVFYILKGGATLIFGDKKLKAKEGDVFLCEPKDLHRVINDSNQEFLLLVFKINTKSNDTFLSRKGPVV